MTLTLAQIVDLAGIGILVLALPAAAVVVAWRHGQLAIQLALSPLFGVFFSLLICHPFALDRRYSAWRVLQWGGYLAVYVVVQVVPRSWIARAARWVGWPVALLIVGETLITAGRGGDLVQGNPNIAAAWMGGLLWLGIESAATWPQWWPWVVAAAAALGATASRGALAGVLLAATERGWRIVALILIVALALARPSTITNRIATWAEAGRLFLARPWVGWGPGSYPLLARADPGRPHADSLPMTVAAEQGLVGLAAWGWLAVWAARAVARSEDPARWGLVAFAVHNLVDNTALWFWPGIAAVVALALVTHRKENPDGGDEDE